MNDENALALQAGSVSRRGMVFYEGRWVTVRWWKKHGPGKHEAEALRRAEEAFDRRRKVVPDSGIDRVAILQSFATLGDEELCDVWQYMNRTHNPYFRKQNNKSSRAEGVG